MLFLNELCLRKGLVLLTKDLSEVVRVVGNSLVSSDGKTWSPLGL